MANKKITELNEASSITSADWLVMVDTGNDETKKIHPDLVGASVPIQDTAPQDPEENDLWIDTSEPEEMQEAIVNEYSESTNETYSCDYVNGIIESGSNANGYYTKYADGTLICRYFVGPITTNAGAGTTTAVTFPYEFVNTDWQTQLTMANGQAYWSYVFANVGDKTKTGFNLKTWNNGGGTNSGQYFDYVAIGRWK